MKGFNKHFILFMLLLTGSVLFAQPANDNPCGATVLTVGAPAATCSPASGANISWTGATATAGVPAPGCASYTTGDVWYVFVAPASGDVYINTNVGAGAGAITDSGMSLYSVSAAGSCPATPPTLALVECDDDDSPNGNMSMITRTDLVGGATYYIRFWDFADKTTANFGGICVTELPPPPPPVFGKDCLAAAPLCCGQAIPAPTAGTGSSVEVIPNDCSSFFTEQNSTWLAFSVTTAGTVSMNFDAVAAIDLDFAAWRIPGTATAPISLSQGCALLTATGTNDRCDYVTSTTESGFGPACGAGTGCDSEGALTVSEGDLIIVMVNDFSTFDNAVFTVTTTLGGGAAIGCAAPTVTVVNSTCSAACGAGTGTATGGSITVSNCVSTATVTEYATSPSGPWTTGTPPYALYTQG